MKKQNYVAVMSQEDSNDFNPREHECNVGHMICAHGRYNLGDEQSTAPIDMGGYPEGEDNFLMWVYTEFIETHRTAPDVLDGWYSDGYNPVFCKEDGHGNVVELEFSIPKSFQAAIERWMDENLCILPLYLIDHSGISMSTGSFGDPWDSGQVGYIYVTKETWDREMNIPFTQDNAEANLKGEVQEYDYYLRGEVYTKTLYRIDDEDFEESFEMSLLESTPLYDLYMAEDVSQYSDVQDLDCCGGYLGQQYTQQCCKEEFPGMCLSDALGDYCGNYLIKQVVPNHNGVLNSTSTRSCKLPRDRTLAFIQKIPEEQLHSFTVEPYAPIKPHTKTKANWRM